MPAIAPAIAPATVPAASTAPSGGALLAIAAVVGLIAYAWKQEQPATAPKASTKPSTKANQPSNYNTKSPTDAAKAIGVGLLEHVRAFDAALAAKDMDTALRNLMEIDKDAWALDANAKRASGEAAKNIRIAVVTADAIYANRDANWTAMGGVARTRLRRLP